MTREHLDRIIDLAEQMAMLRRMAKKLPLHSMQRWKMSVPFFQARKEIEELVRAEAAGN